VTPPNQNSVRFLWMRRLPPASSDERTWWLDNKQSARSDMGCPNPNRLSNLYTLNDEVDWITVPRMRLPMQQTRPALLHSRSPSTYRDLRPRA
jgi:hypothetical protein